MSEVPHPKTGDGDPSDGLSLVSRRTAKRTGRVKVGRDVKGVVRLGRVEGWGGDGSCLRPVGAGKREEGFTLSASGYEAAYITGLRTTQGTHRLASSLLILFRLKQP